MELEYSFDNDSYGKKDDFYVREYAGFQLYLADVLNERSKVYCNTKNYNEYQILDPWMDSTGMLTYQTDEGAYEEYGKEEVEDFKNNVRNLDITLLYAWYGNKAPYNRYMVEEPDGDRFKYVVWDDGNKKTFRTYKEALNYCK